MINALALLGRTSIARFDLAQTVVAATPDDNRDAKSTALSKIADVRSHLDLSLTVVNAVQERIRILPPLPAPVTLQDLVRTGRRKLADLRQRDSRVWIEDRARAADKLQTVLETA